MIGAFRAMDAAMNAEVPQRNRSPHGWWVATYLERAAWDDEPAPVDDTRCLVWENTLLIRAGDREDAYAKALAYGRGKGNEFADAEDGRRGRWVFEGLSRLLPVYDELRDGAELMWTEHRGQPYAALRARLRRKHELEAFDDLGDDEPPLAS